MALIRIHLDGTFESLSAGYSFSTDKEKRDRIKLLQSDLKIMDKVEKLRVDREHNKKTIAGLKGPQKEKACAKDKDLLAKIKELKAKLSSPRHSSSKIIGGMIRQTMDTVVGGKTIAKLAKEASVKPVGRKLKPTRNDPGKGIRRAATIAKPKEETGSAANLTLKDQKILKSLRAGLKSLQYTQDRTKPNDEHYAARAKDIAAFKDKIKALLAKGKDTKKPAKK